MNRQCVSIACNFGSLFGVCNMCKSKSNVSQVNKSDVNSGGFLEVLTCPIQTT